MIAILLYFAEISFLPHLSLWFSVPLLVLPFISVYSVKDRTIFPIILAGMMGIITDSQTGLAVPIYSISYIGIAVISKVFLGKFISYGEYRASFVNVSIGIFIIYGTDLALRTSTITGLFWLVPLLFNISATLLVLFIFIILGRHYFNWIEKETEERFR